MMSDGRLIDGSWELRVTVTDLAIERTLRVTSDLHVGGVMLKLVEDLDVAADWSDHALWWPKRNAWLVNTRHTLDQCGVHADTHVLFTPIHKNLRIQLPDLQYVTCRVDFSTNVFSAVISLCKDLGIRHPEELSLMRMTDDNFIRKGKYSSTANSKKTPSKSAEKNKKATKNGTTPNSTFNTSGDTSLQKTPKNNHTSIYGPYSSPMQSPGSVPSLDGSMNGIDMSLAISPQSPSKEARDSLVRIHSLVERARMSVGWLDSSASLMEQGIRDDTLLLLRFKYYAFFDLNPKYDVVRINQLYEQAKWMIIRDEIDCTEEEMMVFAALQLQINLQSSVPQPDLNTTTKSTGDSEDEIDAALTDLQISLEGSVVNRNSGDLTMVPELGDTLFVMKPKKYTLKSYKRMFLTFRDTNMSAFKSKEDADHGTPPVMTFNVRGSEISPDVNISSGRYTIRVLVPAADGMQEVYIRCDKEEQYARWMAAFRLAMKGKTMADSSYESEVSSILAFLSMQHPAPVPAQAANALDINCEDFVSQRFLAKFRAKGVSQKIVEAHANVTDLTLMDAKLQYLKAWQSLPEYGITYFQARFSNSRKDELLGIAFNRLIRVDAKGQSVKTWRFSSMKEWDVNWEVKQVLVQFEEEKLTFTSTSADCKQAHEFIGGYIFLSMRSKDANQTLNEDLFHKLTGGWQ